MTGAELSHRHDYYQVNEHSERRTLLVLMLTATTMVVEIVAGTLLGSMALLADGWHMATHVAAFLITLFAYRYAKRHAHNPVFSFGTGKVGVLGGFASAIALAMVALMMGIESIARLFNPVAIYYNEAIAIATLGLAVNIVSALLLKEEHHSEAPTHGDHSHDHNLKAAYLHVLADALTSVLAIVALLAGKYFGLGWVDSLMGVVGALIITRWALGLVKQTSPILMDMNSDMDLVERIRATISEIGDADIVDLHLWRVTPHHHALILALQGSHPKPMNVYRDSLETIDGLAHITIEVVKIDDLF